MSSPASVKLLRPELIILVNNLHLFFAAGTNLFVNHPGAGTLNVVYVLAL